MNVTSTASGAAASAVGTAVTGVAKAQSDRAGAQLTASAAVAAAQKNWKDAMNALATDGAKVSPEIRAQMELAVTLARQQLDAACQALAVSGSRLPALAIKMPGRHPSEVAMLPWRAPMPLPTPTVDQIERSAGRRGGEAGPQCYAACRVPVAACPSARRSAARCCAARASFFATCGSAVFLRHVAGGTPNSRLNARLNAASDS